MSYIDLAKEEIKNSWFKNHEIKEMTLDKGLQRFVWGAKGTRMYQIDYVFSNNMVFITGDIGDAVYSLTCAATLENIKDFDLHYFTGKLTAHYGDRWRFDSKKAKEEIEEYFMDWTEAEHYDDFDEEEAELFESLLGAAGESASVSEFESRLFAIYEHDNNVDWFHGEEFSTIAGCGRRLPQRFIAYWLGLQMIAERVLSDASIQR